MADLGSVFVSDMRPAVKPFSFGITAKLLVLNLMIFAVFGVVAGIMYMSFQDITRMTETVMDEEIPRVIRIGRLGRDLSQVFSGTSLLVSTFYGQPETLKTEAARLMEMTDRVMSAEGMTTLRDPLNRFRETLETLFDRCRTVNRRAAGVREIDSAMRKDLDRLETAVFNKKIDRVMAGQSTSMLDQLTALIPSYRESVLTVSQAFSRLDPLGASTPDADRVVRMLGNLHLRLRTLLASEPEIAAFGSRLLDLVAAYQEAVVGFNNALIDFRRARMVVDDAVRATELEMRTVDAALLESTRRMLERNRRTMDASIGFVFLLTGLVIVAFGIFTYLFFLVNIRQPMKAITTALRAIGDGDFDTRISLGRTDEWSLIEVALNQMVSEIWDTYSQLYRKNEAVQKAHRELKASMASLEAEVAQRKEAEAALHRERDLMQLVMETSPVGILAVSPDGGLMLTNPRVTATLGNDGAGLGRILAGINFENLPDWIDAPEAPPRFRVMETGRPERDIQLTCRREGAEPPCYLSVNAAPILNGAGEVSGVVATVEDISDRRLAEAEREKLHRQLIHAQKMEAVGTLAGGIAHDFNNLLQGIQGYAELLILCDEIPASQHQKLDAISRAVERGRDLVQRLLTFARKVEGSFRPVNLNREIRYIRKLLVRTLPKMIDIELRLRDGLSGIQADPVQIEQVLMNLAVNAGDAMPEGGRIVIETDEVVLDGAYCDARPEASPGPHVVLSVTDTGHGMTADIISSIFNPFFTTKEVGKGTGLGLAMVFGIVKDHGGHTTCYSEEGRGSVFNIYLPAIGPVAGDEGEPPAAAIVGGTETILLVDDEPAIRDFGRQSLSAFGYTVRTAADGESALRIYGESETPIDLVILDLNMPGMGGWACLKALLELDPAARILVASGFSQDGAAGRAEAWGAVGFISKPYRMHQICQAVRAVLDDGCGPRPPAG
jgi:PAS domain S-box-containing protein